MKINYLLRNSLLLLSALILMLSCDDDPEPVVYTEPVATFSIDDDNLRVTVNEPFEIISYPQPEGKVYSKWYVDDILESSNTILNHTFITPGEKKVCYQAKNGAGEYSKCFTILVEDILLVGLSIGDSTHIERKQFDELIIAALVEAGSNVEHKWEIDGSLYSTDRVLTGFKLDNLGTHTVKYTATNSAGRYEHDFQVKVVDRPLQINFSPKENMQKKAVGDAVNFNAEIIYGSAGATHEWKVDGVVKSTNSTFDFACEAEGSFEVTYKCVNGLGEEITRSWTVEVVDSSWMIADFELNTFDDKRFTTADKTLSVIENPDKTGINTSNYCMEQYVPNNLYTSGIVWFNFKRDGVNDQVTGVYGGVKFKYYKYTTDRKVEVEMNDTSTKATPVVEGGVTKDGSQAAVNTWVEVEFRFPASFTTDINRLTVRVLRGNGGNPAKALIDDIQLIP